MQEAIQRLQQAAPTDLTVLITGETGTGKEVFANAIHGLSHRKKYPFVSVNCGAIPETLLESELFGHEKGAFTGAIEQRKGFFETAHKGTIFLDEIGEMPIGTQVKLLRVLESGTFSRIGSSDITRVDVRVVVATNRDLEKEVARGNFRQDLFFRLNSVHIVLPPLRHHLEDLPLLIEYFANRACDKLGLKFDGISPGALSVLRSMPWPGNVRELKNLIETVITLEQATYITQDTLRRYIPAALPPPELSPLPYDKTIVKYTDFEETKKFELELVFRTLLEMKNDISEMKRDLDFLTQKAEIISDNVIDIQPVVPTDEVYADTPFEFNDDNLNLDEWEKKLITYALKKFDNNRRLAARALGISERTLYRKLEKFGME
jgi:transcriptional regulator with PAS, ATPase and Fis domain